MGILSTRSAKWKILDFFMLLNVGLFIFMCIFAYYDRFIAYRGSANILEFFVYAVLILLTILIVWFPLRKYSISPWILTFIQIGILMHFFGGLALLGESRLYNHHFFSIRYDKYVHFINSFVAAMVVRQLFLKLGLQLKKMENLVILLCVLGGGAIIEIVEYLVTRTIPDHGVGGYDNNMQDLIANFAGGLFNIVFSKFQYIVGTSKKACKASR